MGFMGQEGMSWFTGVVEDRMDPLELNRVRVRVFGLHTKEKVPNDETGQGIPTKELPWAWVMKSTDSASMDGIGSSSHGLVEGSWVVGFSRDGETMNDLIVIGSVGGIPKDPPQDKQGKFGFVDPRTADQIASSPRKVNQEEGRDPGYPGQRIPMGRYPQEAFLGEPDVNRLARAKKLDGTYLKPKKLGLVRTILTALGRAWSEKSVPYGAKYPYNHIRETECGHVLELDDTPGKERIHVYHFKGSYVEFHPDGSIQVKSVKDQYEVALKDRKVYAMGNVDVTANLGLSLLSTVGPISMVATVGGIQLTSVLPINITSTTAVNLVAPLVTANGTPIG